MNRTYVSILSTDTYLPGVLVLHNSLSRTAPRYPFLLLITPNVSDRVRRVLTRHGINYNVLEQPIANPTGVEETHRWHYNYSKIHIFNQVQFDKIVFLDADMLISANLDELLEKPHMSAVNSGGLLPELSSWKQLNSGLLVIEPSTDLFTDMIGRIGAMDPRQPAGDQAFLHTYYSDWPSRKELHLDHRYNMFAKHLDRYYELFGYTLADVKVLHFVGETKPWTPVQPPAPKGWRRRFGALLWRTTESDTSLGRATMLDAANRMWLQCYGELEGSLENFGATSPLSQGRAD